MKCRRHFNGHWIDGIPVGDNPAPCADKTGGRDCAVLVADAVGETNIMWVAGAVTSCILMAGGVVVYTGPGKWHTRSNSMSISGLRL